MIIICNSYTILRPTLTPTPAQLPPICYVHYLDVMTPPTAPTTDPASPAAVTTTVEQVIVSLVNVIRGERDTRSLLSRCENRALPLHRHYHNDTPPAHGTTTGPAPTRIEWHSKPSKNAAYG